MSAAVDLARSWLGTPYQHQSACKGAGCDCLGLLLGVWAEMGGGAVGVPNYSADWSEPQGAETLWAEARARLWPAGDLMAQGDVLLFRMKSGAVAKHLGLLSRDGDHPLFIHAYSGHGVVESRLTAAWTRRLVARFRLPTL